MIIGRAYALIAFLGMYSLLFVYMKITGEKPDGTEIYIVLGLSLSLTFGISLIRKLGEELRVAILQSNYYSFVIGTFLLCDLNLWSVFFLLIEFVVVMMTYQAIRSIRGLWIFSAMVIVISAGLVWTGPVPASTDSIVIFMIMTMIVGGSFIVSFQKLTDERRRFEVESEIREHKRLLHGILESSEDLIWSVDHHLHIINGNSPFFTLMERLDGGGVQAGAQMPSDSFQIPNWYELVQQAFSGNSQFLTQTIQFTSGFPVSLDIRLMPITEDGKIIAVSGFARDVTDTIALQSRIHKAQERYENAASVTKDGIWEWDLINRTVHLSDRLQQLVGRTILPKDQTSGSFGKLLHPEDLPKVVTEFRELIRGNTERIFGEVRMKHADGTWRWMEGRGSAIRDQNGRVLRISGAITDITERKKSEQELQKLSLVARKTSNAVIIIDAKGNIEWTNEGFTKISGYELEEVIGKRPGSFLLGEDTNRETVEMIREKIQTGETVSTEILNYHKDGTSYWISIEVTPIRNAKGVISNYMIIESDITSQKVNEFQLRVAKKKAEEAANAKSEFLATMSHEIRTPMNAVIGMTGLLLDSPLSEEQRDFVETIRVSGDNLLTIINDILDFSKIDAGKLDFEQQIFSLPETIEDVLDLLSSKAQAKGLELTYEADPNVPASIISDPTRLNQILVNLIGNAIKFTSQGGVNLLIKESNRYRDVSQLQFSVRDTGIGIHEEKQQNLFKPFSQVDVSTTRKYGGTGLGLAISSRLVQLLGGDIWVESKVGEGSVFHFSIRVKVHEDTTFLNYVSPSQGIGLAGKQVLLVDDSLTNLRILTAQLTSWGMLCDACEAPGQVSQMIAQKQYDLLILDMHMQEMNGLHLARQLTSTFGPDTPPMMMLTSIGQSLLADERELFKSFLHKPVRREQLYKRISRVLSPAERPQNLPERHKQEVSSDPMPMLKVLIAEDNLVNQKVARRMLKKLGYAAEVVANGQEAVEIVQQRAFDLIFMDMRMPVMDGLEATRQIRTRFPSESMKIIAMTANALKGDRDICLEVGMDDYITKPVKITQIREAILRTCPPFPRTSGYM